MTREQAIDAAVRRVLPIDLFQGIEGRFAFRIDDYTAENIRAEFRKIWAAQ